MRTASGPQSCPLNVLKTLKVAVAELELELGDARALAQEPQREPRFAGVAHALAAAAQELQRKWHQRVLEGMRARGGLHPNQEITEVRLESNLFQTEEEQLLDRVEHDTTPFKIYKDAWGNGPLIPLFARVWIRDSLGGAVEAPLALGRVRFLWEWKDASRSLRDLSATTKSFVKRRVEYPAGNTAGQNCHHHRGGKRGAPAAVFFPPREGQPPSANWASGFPFQVTPAVRRTGTVLSTAWTTGVLAGKTGVLFQPSRMAGDAYRVSVHLASELRDDGQPLLDDTPNIVPLPVVRGKATCTLEVWREIHIVRYLKKRNDIRDLSLAQIQEHYKPAFIRLVDRTGGSRVMDAAEYTGRVARYAASLDRNLQEFREYHSAIDLNANRYARGKCAIHFRDFAAFRRAYLTGLPEAEQKEWSDDNLWVRPNTAEKYYNVWCSLAAMRIVTEIYQDDLDDEQFGITFLQFEGLHNHEGAPGIEQTAGSAEFFSSNAQRKRDRHHAMFALFGHAQTYQTDGTERGGSTTDTVAHEIGHLLLLPHAPFSSTERTPGGSRADLHDPAGNDCLMGYNLKNARNFCGFCVLRLRGWDTQNI